jgi:hypothetical protein
MHGLQASDSRSGNSTKVASGSEFKMVRVSAYHGARGQLVCGKPFMHDECGDDDITVTEEVSGRDHICFGGSDR